MRVALVTENFLPKLDGVTRTLAMLLEHLQRRGHRVALFGPSGAPDVYAGARVFGAPGVPLPFYPELRALIPTPLLEERLVNFQPDVVHVVEPMLLGAAGIHWAQKIGAPLVSSYHTDLAAYCAYYQLGALAQPVWAYRRFLHNLCLHTLCPSPTTASQVAARGIQRVGVWPRGVDAALFAPERRSAAWRARITGAAVDTPIVLYVGRLSPEKNLAALVAAFRALADTEAHLVLVGDGPARGQLEQALGGPRVTFTGYLSGEALATAYASADVFAFPSLTETFGQVAQEAMASGLPVVAFDAGGVHDLVAHERTGLLAPAGDAAAFAAALAALVASPARRLRLGAQGREFALRHTWERVMDGLLEVYAASAATRRVTRAA
ncbi:MAG TPA: glycosyltransferase family 1 protein [Ktedonobacterales bacterium]|nr:glycosyltransferase family 1 protein [Ktedonobacterales bacterium]